MYTITRPETPKKKLPRKPKKALRALQQDGGGTPRQQKLARAFLRQGLRITTPYVGFNQTGEYLVVSERYRPGYPPISHTLKMLMAELQSYGYELLTTETDDYDRVDSYIFHLPLMAKCSSGHYTPYRKMVHGQARCEHCNEELWKGTVPYDRVRLWQGQEYADDETTVPAPPMIEIFYDFNGRERPKPPVPPKGRRRRRYLKARKRWNDIQWGIYNAQVAEEIARGHEEWLREEHEAMMPIDPQDSVQGPVKFTPEMEEVFTHMVEAHTAAPFGHQTFDNTVLMFLYEQVKGLEGGESLSFEAANREAIRRSDDYPSNPHVKNAALVWERAIRRAWRLLKRQLGQ